MHLKDSLTNIKNIGKKITTFFTKHSESLLIKDTVYKISTICVVILILTLFYLLGIGLTYGFVILDNSYYNLTTDCPNNNPNCLERCYLLYKECINERKMLCHEGHMETCVGLGLATMWLVAMLFSIIMFICLVIKHCYLRYSCELPDITNCFIECNSIKNRLRASSALMPESDDSGRNSI